MERLPVLTQTIGAWDPEPLGYHRVVLHVDEATGMARAKIPWRRRDREPEKQQLVVVSEQTGATVGNVVRIDINREFGDIAFEPIDGAGAYWVYFMPYTGTTKSAYPKTGPEAPTDSTDPAWLDRSDVDAAPAARVVEIQSSGEHDAFTEMEWIATREETEGVLARHPDAQFIVFPEDRTRPIRMTTDLPARWTSEGFDGAFKGEALRGEHYVFQLGLWAARGTARDVEIEFGDLISEGGTIRAGSFRCVNSGGTGWDGQPLEKSVSVPIGTVQALYCGVDIPTDATAGSYRGDVTVRSAEGHRHTVTLEIAVGEATINDAGDDEPWRLSRLRWLDSRKGTEDEVFPPFTTVGVDGDTLRVLGREVELGACGLPGSITSFFSPEVTEIIETGREILAAPIGLIVQVDGAQTDWRETARTPVGSGRSWATWKTTAETSGLSMTCEGRMELDGMVDYAITVRAEEAIDLDDIRLEVPLPEDVARLMTGLGRKGGACPDRFEWAWDVEKNHDSIWIGDVNAGIQIALRDEHYSRPLNTNFYHLKPLVMPTSWSNEGKGGIRFEREGGACMVTCHSGARRMETGEELRFDFRLLLTPFKPIDTTTHFNTRYYHSHAPMDEVAEAGANTINVHHANEINPYINYPFLRPEGMKAYIDEAHARDYFVKIYYTVRELTTRAPELFALKSLGDEIIVNGPGGGHPWLREHLATNYIAAWHAEPVEDTSVINGVLSRWHNFYVEGLDWLARNVGIDGLYLDDVGFGREVMQRARRVLARRRERPILDLHSANQYNERDGFASSANLYLELFPYLDRLWFGEYFDYSEPPEYWLVEVAGIPFGLMSEMLEGGGNPWRGMVFGMTGRMPRVEVNRALWRFWDEVGLPDARMIGWWSENCPVQTGRDDVKATVYVGEERTVIALASWAEGDVEVTLEVDWDASMSAPEIEGFQPALEIPPGDPIAIEPGKGWLLVLETQG